MCARGIYMSMCMCIRKCAYVYECSICEYMSLYMYIRECAEFRYDIGFVLEQPDAYNPMGKYDRQNCIVVYFTQLESK